MDRAGLDKLMWASNAARTGSLDALKGQYQRLAQELFIPRSPAKAAVEAEVIELSSRGSSPRRPPVKALPPPAAKVHSPPPPPPPPPRAAPTAEVARPRPKRKTSGRDFYCRYSVDLQLSPRPLSRAFDPGRGSACPVCSAKLAVDSADMWEFKLPVKEKLPPAKATSRDPSPPGKSQTREKKTEAKDRGRSKTGKEVVAVAELKQKQKMVKFRIPAKFVVKCHTPEGDYACVLCCGPSGNYSGVVVLCDDPESLVDHVVKEHDAADIEKEIDIIAG